LETVGENRWEQGGAGVVFGEGLGGLLGTWRCLRMVAELRRGAAPSSALGALRGFCGGREASGEWCEGESGAGGPFYRQREGVRRGWAVASANHGVRAGVILWGRDDVRGMASARRETEGRAGSQGVREVIEESGADRGSRVRRPARERRFSLARSAQARVRVG
jgi:hypothetical protein